MVTRANVEATKAFIRARLGNPYVYGGALSENVRQGTDCSEVWQTVLEMAHGRWVQGRQSEGATTESYRYIPVGGVGPFGTIRVNHWRDIPADAAARIAFHHGEGGGANSHMWGELDGMRIESGGSKGLQTGDRALAVESSYATAWAYLPGPIGGVASLGIGSTGPQVITLQERLNRDGAGLDVDGDYGPATATAVSQFQQRAHVVGDPPGVAGEATLNALSLNEQSVVDDTRVTDILARATGLSFAKAAQILPTIREGLNLAECTNPDRIAMALAQWGHESANFNATEEYASGDAYDTRTDLGNTPEVDGDGRLYKGRTYIQITGKSNYRKFSEWAHARGLVPTPDYFVVHPTELSDVKWAGIGAAWYWTVARGTRINDASDRRDIVTVTQLINGGQNGIDDRRRRYALSLPLGAQLLALLSKTELDEWEALMADNTLYPSTSPYRTDDTPVLTLRETLRQNNGMLHGKLIEDAALEGHPDAIAMVAKLARGEGPAASDLFKVAQAQNIIRTIQARIAAQTGAPK